MAEVLKDRAPDLDDLAKQIDAAHIEVGAALLTSVRRAAEAGHLLAQAKEQVPHGQWEAWVEEKTAVSPRTARSYMQVSRHWIEADKAKRRALADLGLQGFLVEIAEPRPIPVDKPADSTPSPSWMRGAVTKPDREVRHTLVDPLVWAAVETVASALVEHGTLVEAGPGTISCPDPRPARQRARQEGP